MLSIHPSLVMPKDAHKQGLLKLGRRPPAKTRQFVPMLRDHLAGPFYTPTHQDWSVDGKVGYWGMMLNDSLGCCVISSKGHLIILLTTLAGTHKNIIIPDQSILVGYEQVGGYVPGEWWTDNGCDMLTAANYFANTGFGGHKATAFAGVHPQDVAMLQAGINMYGATELGIAMPISAQSQDVWDVPPGGTTGDGAPGSWGGHCVPAIAFDQGDKTYKVVTWGYEKIVTERFLTTYCDEAYTYLSPDWITDGHGPNKFTVNVLSKDLPAI